MTGDWTGRLRELATEENVPGAALAVWADGRQSAAAHGVLNAATGVSVTPDSLVAAMTGDRAALSDDPTQEADLYPADGTGDAFVCRTRDHQPWTALVFGRLADQTRYVYQNGRVTPRVGQPISAG